MAAYPAYKRISLKEAAAFIYLSESLLVVGLNGDNDLIINAKDLQAQATSNLSAHYVSIQQEDESEIGFIFSLVSGASEVYSDASLSPSVSQTSSSPTLDHDYARPGWANVQTITILQHLKQRQTTGIFSVRLTAEALFLVIRFPVFSIAAHRSVKDILEPCIEKGM